MRFSLGRRHRAARVSLIGHTANSAKTEMASRIRTLRGDGGQDPARMQNPAR